jgi:hypothetical protein
MDARRLVARCTSAMDLAGAILVSFPIGGLLIPRVGGSNPSGGMESPTNAQNLGLLSKAC